jgi:hypothetical protein
LEVETGFEVRQAKRTAGFEAVEPNFEARQAKRTVGFEAVETDFEVRQASGTFAQLELASEPGRRAGAMPPKS